MDEVPKIDSDQHPFSSLFLKNVSVMCDADGIGTEAITAAITLTEQDTTMLQNLRETSFVGDPTQIAIEIEAMAKKDGAWTDMLRTQMLAKLKRKEPAFLYGGRTFIRSDILSEPDFIEIAKAHENIESIFSQFDHNTATQNILNSLGLSSFTNGRDGKHFVAMIFELYEAKKRGLLNEWLNFRSEYDLTIAADKKDDTQYLDKINKQKQAREYVASLVRKIL